MSVHVGSALGVGVPWTCVYGFWSDLQCQACFCCGVGLESTQKVVAVHRVHKWVRPSVALSPLPGLSELSTERNHPSQHQLGFSVSHDQHVWCPQQQGLAIKFL